MKEQIGFWIACLILLLIVAMGCPFPGDMVEHLTNVCVNEYGPEWRYSTEYDLCVGFAQVPTKEAKY